MSVFHEAIETIYKHASKHKIVVGIFVASCLSFAFTAYEYLHDIVPHLVVISLMALGISFYLVIQNIKKSGKHSPSAHLCSLVSFYAMCALLVSIFLSVIGMKVGNPEGDIEPYEFVTFNLPFYTNETCSYNEKEKRGECIVSDKVVSDMRQLSQKLFRMNEKIIFLDFYFDNLDGGVWVDDRKTDSEFHDFLAEDRSSEDGKYTLHIGGYQSEVNGYDDISSITQYTIDISLDLGDVSYASQHGDEYYQRYNGAFMVKTDVSAWMGGIRLTPVSVIDTERYHFTKEKYKDKLNNYDFLKF